MRVLGIETATPYGSIAVVGAEGLLAEAGALVPMGHLEWLLPAIERALQDAGLDRDDVEGLAVSQGPGGFTGLRIGIATAAAWARAMGIPLIGVSTLEALAAGPAGPGRLLPVLDARRGEVAAALFRREEDDRLVRLREDTVLAPEDLAPWSTPEPVLVLGDGLDRYGEVLRRVLTSGHPAPRALWTPRAALVAALGRVRLLAGDRVDPYRLAPVYGRRPAVAPVR